MLHVSNPPTVIKKESIVTPGGLRMIDFLGTSTLPEHPQFRPYMLLVISKKLEGISERN
jgi:hypothetical protein